MNIKLKEIKKITLNRKLKDISTKKKLDRLSEKIKSAWKSKKTALELLKESRN